MVPAAKLFFNGHSYEETDQLWNEIFKQSCLRFYFSQKPTTINCSFIMCHLLMKKGYMRDVFDCM